MINRSLLALFFCLAPASLLAQVRVELSFEQETYLPQEPMYAVVQIYNFSGQTLQLGRDNEWLTFSVEAADGSVVRQKKPADVKREFTLPNASRAKRLVNLAEAYEMTRFGRYLVTATVRIPGWSREFTVAKAEPVGISKGVKLWENVFGMASEEPGGRPEVRKFQLIQANHLKELSLYVRITDETEAETFSLFPLGHLISFSRPEAQVDRWSNLHVMYQDGARTYRYNMITRDGLLLARQTWHIGETRPAMTMNSEGRISVTGGVRKISASDLPPPELLSGNATPGGVEALQSEKPVDAEKASK